MRPNLSIVSEKNLRESDESIWNAFRSGSKQAYDFIYQEYIRMLYQYGSKLTTERAFVEDCIQEVFIELWIKKSSLGETNSIKFYLFASLRRKIIRKLKKESWHRNLISVFKAIPFEVEFSFENKIIEEELSASKKVAIDHALKRLSKREREIIYLRFYEDISYKEISQLMEMKLPSVYSLAGRAIARLRKIMQS